MSQLIETMLTEKLGKTNKGKKMEQLAYVYRRDFHFSQFLKAVSKCDLISVSVR